MSLSDSDNCHSFEWRKLPIIVHKLTTLQALLIRILLTGTHTCLHIIRTSSLAQGEREIFQVKRHSTCFILWNLPSANRNKTMTLAFCNGITDPRNSIYRERNFYFQSVSTRSVWSATISLGVRLRVDVRCSSVVAQR